MSQAVDSIQTPNAPAPASPARGGAPAPVFERRPVLHAAVDIATPAAIVAYLSDCMRLRRGCMVVGISAPYAMAMRDDAALRDAFLKADLLVPDGKGFVWGARWLGAPCGERIAIPDLCERLLERCNESGLKVFIYGATDEINAAACANVRKRFPKIAAVAGQHGYGQGPADEDALIARLKVEQFQLLIVARPSPDKELFLARCCKEAGVVGLAAGGYADILAGKTRRAPEFVQNIGMEWMWRVAQEPLRLWKRVGWANARFAAAVAWQRLRMDPGRPWWGSRTIQFTLIVLAVTAAYVGAINAPYHFDDPEYIQHNPTIRSFKALSGITVLARRNLWWLSNAICYKLSELYGNHQTESPDVRVFRLWNIVCHFIAALALMGLVRRCLRAAGYLPHGPPGRGTPYDMAAFAAGAIFAAHPLCTESVTYICGRDNGQGGMFYLLGLYAAAICFDRLSDASRMPAQKLWPSWLWPMFSMLAFGYCAWKTKEVYLTFPPAVFLVYLFFYRSASRRTVSAGLLLGLLLSTVILAWGASGRHEGYLGPAFQAIVFVIAAGGLLGGWPPAPALLRRRLHVGWALLLCVLGLGAAALVADPYAYQRTLGALAGQENSNYVRSLCSQAYAVPWMLLRTIVPFGLNIDHEFPSISDPHDPRVFTGAAIIAGLTLFGVLGIFRGWLGSFGVLLALLTIAPSNTVIERGDIVSERNFYLAAAGGACFIAWFMVVLTGGLRALIHPTYRAIGEAKWTRRLPALHEAGLWTGTLACCLAGPFTSFTILRNQDWMEPLRLWESSVKEGSKNKIRVLYNLGNTYASLHRYDDAENQFTNVLSIGIEKVEKNLFRSDEAVEIKCFHLAYLDLARMQLLRYMKSGRQGDFAPLNRIDELLKKGLERTTYDPDLTLGYAQFQNERGFFNQALPDLKRSLELHRSAEQLHYPIGVAQLETGETLAAMQSLTMASNMRDIHALGVELDMPAENASDIYAFLGLSKFLLKDYHGAATDFVRSLTFDPHGITQMIMVSMRTRNPNLHAVDINPPDVFLEALTRMRRDLLRQLRDCAERALQNDKLVRSRTLVENLQGSFDMELKRRAAVQARREKAGFTDDPDDIVEPPK